MNTCGTCKYFGSPRIHNGDVLSDAYNMREPEYKWCGRLQIGEWGAPERDDYTAKGSLLGGMMV